MPSIRQRIRSQALVVLANLATTGARVWPVREHRPLLADELPALLVQVDDGAGLFSGTIGLTQDRTARLVISALVRQTDDYDDVIEQVWREVEPALAADRTLGGAIKQFGAWSLGSKQTEPVGELIVIRQTLQIECLWFAPFGSPDASL